MACCRGLTRKQRLLEKLLAYTQGMLHRIEGAEEENTDTSKASLGRAKTLHARYHAFTQGNFVVLRADERKHTGGSPNQTMKGRPKQKLGGKPPAMTNEAPRTKRTR